MASGTWTNALEDGDWANGANWADDGGTPLAAGDYPVDGNTVTFDVFYVSTPPTLNLPSTGTFNVAILGDWSAYYIKANLIGGGATIGTISVATNSPASSAKVDANFAGGNVDGTLTVKANTSVTASAPLTICGGTLQGEGGATFTGAITCGVDGATINTTGVNVTTTLSVADGGSLEITGTGSVTLNGASECAALALSAGTLAVGTQTLVCTSLTKTGGNVTGSGTITVSGALSLTGGTWGHTGVILIPSTSTVTPDIAASQRVGLSIEGSVTLGAAVNLLSLTIATGGTLAQGAYAIDCTGLSVTGGTWTASAGAVCSVAGNISVTGGALPAAGEVRQTATGTVVNNNTSNRFFNKLVLAPTAGVTSTLTGLVGVKAFEYGAGTVTGEQDLFVIPAAANFFTCGTGSLGIARVLLFLTGNTSLAGTLCTSGLSNSLVIYGTSGTLTVSGIANNGSVPLYVYGTSTNTISATFSAGLTTGNVTLGASAGSGVLTLPASGALRGNVAASGTGAANALTITGNYTLTGTVTGTGIAVTSTGGVIVGGTVNSVTSTGDLLHLYPAAAGTGNTGVTEISPSKARRRAILEG